MKVVALSYSVQFATYSEHIIMVTVLGSIKDLGFIAFRSGLALACSTHPCIS